MLTERSTGCESLLSQLDLLPHWVVAEGVWPGGCAWVGVARWVWLCILSDISLIGLSAQPLAVQ